VAITVIVIVNFNILAGGLAEEDGGWRRPEIRREKIVNSIWREEIGREEIGHRNPLVGIDDGQTNGINFIPFVCPSRSPIRGERARTRGVVVGIDDEQTNGIIFFTFVCPSRTPIEAQ
jgi:hypothetical protein